MSGDIPDLEQIVSRTKVSDLIKDTLDQKKGIVTVLETSLAGEAFEKMTANKFLSVPVYSKKDKRYISFIDMLDMVAYLSHIFDSAELESHGLASAKAKPITVEKLADLSRRNPFHTVDSNAPVREAMLLMHKYRLHRLAVIDGEGEMVALLTQSFVIRHLYNNRFSFMEELGQTVGSIHLGEKPVGVVTIRSSEKAVDAFREMHRHGVSAVAVVDDNGALENVISAADLKLLGSKGEFVANISFSIGDFLARWGPREPVTVTNSDTFETVLERMVKSKVHRVFVVSEDKKPIGVISGAELIQVLLKISKSVK